MGDRNRPRSKSNKAAEPAAGGGIPPHLKTFEDFFEDGLQLQTQAEENPGTVESQRFLREACSAYESAANKQSTLPIQFNWALCLHSLAEAESDMRTYDRIIEMALYRYDAVLQLDPNYADALNNSANALCNRAERYTELLSDTRVHFKDMRPSELRSRAIEFLTDACLRYQIASESADSDAEIFSNWAQALSTLGELRESRRDKLTLFDVADKTFQRAHELCTLPEFADRFNNALVRTDGEVYANWGALLLTEARFLCDALDNRTTTTVTATASAPASAAAAGTIDWALANAAFQRASQHLDKALALHPADTHTALASANALLDAAENTLRHAPLSARPDALPLLHRALPAFDRVFLLIQQHQPANQQHANQQHAVAPLLADAHAGTGDVHRLLAAFARDAFNKDAALAHLHKAADAYAAAISMATNPSQNQNQNQNQNALLLHPQLLAPHGSSSSQTSPMASPSSTNTHPQSASAPASTVPPLRGAPETVYNLACVTALLEDEDACRIHLLTLLNANELNPRELKEDPDFAVFAKRSWFEDIVQRARMRPRK